MLSLRKKGKEIMTVKDKVKQGEERGGPHYKYSPLKKGVRGGAHCETAGKQVLAAPTSHTEVLLLMHLLMDLAEDGPSTCVPDTHMRD